MNFLKAIVVAGVISLPLVGMGQIYQAGQAPSRISHPSPAWDVSLGVYRSYMKVVDPVQETLFSNEQGLSARGLYAFTPWLWVGAEGGITQREDFPVQNTYHHLYYGAVTKWILTPQTRPQVYLLFGGGVSRRKLSYAGSWEHTITKPYVVGATGVELPLGQLGYVGLEAQARYTSHRTLDAFTILNHRLEVQIGLRGGVRF